MKQTKFLYAALACACLLTSTSCSDDDTPKVPVQLKTMEATIKSTPEHFKDWELYIGNERYQFTLAGNKLSATPSTAPYEFKDDAPLLIEMRQDYGRSRSETSIKDFSYGDQSTWNDFIRFATLSGTYSGQPTENLENIELKHTDVLVDFTITGMPEGSEIYVGQEGTIIYGGGDGTMKPLPDANDPTAYKVIHSTSINKLILRLRIGDVIHNHPIAIDDSKMTRMPNPGPPQLPKGTIISFKAHVDEELNFTVTDLKLEYDKDWNL